MSYKKKRIDQESKYMDQSGSYRSSMPRWVDMANFKDGYEGYQYTDHWGQLSLKYAPSYYKNEPLTKHSQSMADSSSTTKSDMYDNQITRGRQRCKIAFILVVVCLLAIAAIIIPVLVVFLKPADIQPEKYMVATMNLTLAETFRDEYNNKSSPEYKSFEQNFTNAMDEIYKKSNITGYNGIQIQSLRNGSIIVTFIIVIAVKRAEESPGEQALKAIIIEQPKDKNDNTVVLVKNFKIRPESVSVALTEYVNVNPITPEATTTTTTLAITTPTVKPSTQAITTTTPNTTATPTSTPTSTSTSLTTNPSTTTTKSTSTAATTTTTPNTTAAPTSKPTSTSTSLTTNPSTTTTKATSTAATTTTTPNTTATSTSTPTSTSTSLTTNPSTTTTKATSTAATTTTTPNTTATPTSTPTSTSTSLTTNPSTTTTKATSTAATTITTKGTTHAITTLPSTSESSTTSTTKSDPKTTTQPTIATSSSTSSITASTYTTTTTPTSTSSTLSIPPGLNTTTTTLTLATTTQPSTGSSTSAPIPDANTTSRKSSIPTIVTQPTTTNATHYSTILSSTTEMNTNTTTISTPTTTTQTAITSSTSSSSSTSITTSTPIITTRATSTASTLSTPPELNTSSTTSSTPTTTMQPNTTRPTSAPTQEPNTTSTTTSTPTTTTQPSTTRSTSQSTTEPNTTRTATSTPTATTQPSSNSTIYSSTMVSSTPEFNTTSMKTSTPTTTTTSTTSTSVLTPEPNTTSTAASTTTTTTRSTTPTSVLTPEPNTTSTAASTPTTTTRSTTPTSVLTPEPNTTSTAASTITSTTRSTTPTSVLTPEPNTTSMAASTPTTTTRSTTPTSLLTPEQNTTSTAASKPTTMTQPTTTGSSSSISEQNTASTITPTLSPFIQPSTAEATMNVTLDESFKPGYADSSSSEYLSFVQNFTTAMDQIYKTSNITGYNGIQIQELRNGSVIVIFVIIIEVKQGEKPPQAEALVAVITQQPTDQVDTAILVISNMRIRKPSVTVVTIVVGISTPITTSTTARITSTPPSTTPTTTTTPATSTISATMPETSMITTGIPTMTTTHISSTSSIQDTTSKSITLTLSTSTQPTTSTKLIPSITTQPTATYDTSSSTLQPNSTSPTSVTTATNTTSSSIVTDTTTTHTTFSQRTTTVMESTIAFSKDNYTSILGAPLQLTCMVTRWNGDMNISRVSKLSQSEVNVISLVNNETESIRKGFAVNKTLVESNVYVFILILNMTCDDEGTYYCKSGSVSDSATVKREREKPTLQLSDIMIRDQYHSVNYPFVCEAEVETPGEVLIAEVNRNGTYYHYEGYGESRQNITVDCVQKQIFKFYINGKFTQDWDNAKIRCVVMYNLTNVENDILMASDEKTIQLLPADICSGVADGSNITHPYSTCELFLTCMSGVPVLGKCQQGQCFYDNIGVCRAPMCPFLYCRDTEVNIGDSASMSCEIIFCNNSFSLSIKHSEEILFSNVNISGNISLKSDDKDIQISVSHGAALVTLTLNKTNCNHTGEYIIDLDRGSFIDRSTLRLKVLPKIPILQLPQSIVAYTETTISCTGEQGVPQQDMYIEVMFNGRNFSKYDKITLTRNSQNCSNMGTLVMNFLVEDMWDGARIRCVIGYNSSSRLESDVHEINITYTGVRFSSTKFTGFINGTVQMTCIVNGVFNGDNVIISRSNAGILGEKTLSNITVGNSTRSNVTGIQISTTNVSVSDMLVHVSIDSLQCHDGGTYYCKTGNRTATTTLEIWRKPDKPKLKLPVNVVSDGYNQGGDPFVCEGNVGYPGGNLAVLFNKDGNVKEAQPFSPKMITGNVTECGRVDKFEFYLTNFTTDLHNLTVRCVAANNKTLSNESAPFDDKVLLLVPGNTCYGATEGLILPYPYPFYDCGKYIYCSWNQTFVKDGWCKDGECYYTDIKRCEQERTTTTTKPTTTTQVACPSITCSGADPVINSAATITCALILCGYEFDLVIELNSKVQFRETMRGNRTSPFLTNALLNLVVKDDTAELNIVFENIMCNQSGAYNVSIYGGNVSSVAAINIRVNPEKPNITAPSNIYKDQKAIFSCIGQLGIPSASMFWQLMLPGGNFETYSVSGSPDISKSDCRIIGNWTTGIYPEQSWNGGGIRCVTKTQGNPSIEIYSDAITITLEEPDVYFAPSSSSGYIGSSHSITCIAKDMTNIMSVKIERQTNSGLHEVASLAIDGTSTTNVIGIRIRNTSMINSTAATVYTEFDNLTCADKGDYFCTIGAFSSRGNLSILRKPEVPQMVTFPTSGILENAISGTINCTGEVGYPAGKIVFESNKGGNNTFAPVPFSYTSTQMEGECSTTYSATFSYIFNMDWNSTVIRCKIDTGDVLGDSGTSLYVDRKILIIPGNICETSNTIYVPHPYACRKYVWCAGRIFFQECSPTLCHWTVPDNTTACGYCSGCIDSF